MRVFVTVRYLQQCDPGQLTPPLTRIEWAHLTRVLRPSTGLARSFYVRVGERHRWRGRLDWDDQAWQQVLGRRGTELWISWFRDTPTGFAELTGGAGPGRTTTRIAYLGLLPEFRGRGLGGHLVAHATQRAWTVHRRHRDLPPVERVELDTSTLDSTRALPTYVKRGYQLVGEEEREITIPDRVAVGPAAPRSPLDSAAATTAGSTRPGA
jgi:GNAT superfamily N-acetyltransferase